MARARSPLVIGTRPRTVLWRDSVPVPLLAVTLPWCESPLLMAQTGETDILYAARALSMDDSGSGSNFE